MKILDAHIDGFGKFSRKDFSFTEGLNVIYGPNESGKSTLHAFLEAMLFGPDRKSKNFAPSVHERMEPWDETVPYQGTLRVLHQDTPYRIERVFTKGQESLSVYNETTRQYEPDPEAFLKEALCGMTPAALRNTVSIGQLSAKTGTDLAKEIKTFIENIGSTLNPALSAEKAVSRLQEKKENLQAKLQPEAARDYAASLSRIKNLEGELSLPENDNRLLSFEGEKEKISEQLHMIEAEMISTEEDLSETGRVLSDHHLSQREDVQELDREADDLYDEWKEYAAERKKPGRVVVIVLSALLLLASLLGYFLYQKSVIFLFAAAVSFVFLILFLCFLLKARRNFSRINEDLLSFMKDRNGDTEVSEESMGRLRADLHRFDDLITRKEQDISMLNGFTEKRDALLSEKSRCSDEIENQHKIRFAVEGKLSEENELRSRASGLRDMIAQNNRLKQQIDAIDIAIDTIRDLEDTISDRIGSYLNDEASGILSEITGGRYRGIEIGNGNDILLNTRDGMISIRSVSAGTADQVYLSVRLAAARLMAGGLERLPLVFDDSFTLYDDGRLRKAVSFIKENCGGQVLVFTCQHREADALEGKEFNLIEL